MQRKNSVTGGRRSSKPKAQFMVPDCFGSSCSEKLGQAQPLVSRPFLATSPRFRFKDTGRFKVFHRLVVVPQALCLTWHMPLQFCFVLFFLPAIFSFFASHSHILQETGHVLPLPSLKIFSFSPKDLTKQMLVNIKPCELTLSEIFLSF